MVNRILWHSVSPLCPTGYGVQTSLFAPRIAAAGYEVAISSGYGLNGQKIDYGGVKVYPGFDWNSQVGTWWNKHRAGEGALVLTLMDVWPLDRAVFRHINDTDSVACWVPVDHSPCPGHVASFFTDTGARPIAMSRFGETELRNAGLDPLYVPHGVDTEILKPFERDLARKHFNLPQDAFIVGIVANNEGISPPRKAFPEALMAFKDFHDNHPEAILYLHTFADGDVGLRQGVDLRIVASHFDIPPEAVYRTSDMKLLEGMHPAELAALYSSFDVLMNASHGEGFGVPIVEAQACGTPVVVTDWTSMPELVGAGWAVGGERWYDCQHYSWFRRPDVGEMTVALEDLHAMNADERAALSVKAREFAVQYDADHVMETYWKPVLEELTRPREVQPLGPNRKMRRAKAKAA